MSWNKQIHSQTQVQWQEAERNVYTVTVYFIFAFSHIVLRGEASTAVISVTFML